MNERTIVVVCGARPNFMKIAPIMRVIAATKGLKALLVHTGQHYDKEMSELFFDQLGIPKPDVDLGVGSLSHAVQTAEIMKRFEPVCLEHSPSLVAVVGDVNSTIACALVAAKLQIPVAHIEAGLRSGDRGMPEEINRVLTDSISDYLFVTEPSGVENLLAEGVSEDKIHHVGNVMIDTLLEHRESAELSTVLTEHGLTRGEYVTVTLHRPSNVDDESNLTGILRAIHRISARCQVVFAVHPRTRKQLERFALLEALETNTGIVMIGPQGYLDFLKLTANSAVVLTDSGGIQEETTILGVPCLTVRENTERPVTISQGTNRLVAPNEAAIMSAYEEAISSPVNGTGPPLWDGHAAERIVEILERVA